MSTRSTATTTSAAPPTIRQRWDVAFILAGVLFSLVQSASAAARLDDVELTLQARQALLQQQSLAPLNLGVRVRHGIATMYGQVPAPELSRLAEAQLRRVPGLAGIRNGLHVDSVSVPNGAAVHSPSGRRQRQGPVPATVLPGAAAGRMRLVPRAAALLPPSVQVSKPLPVLPAIALPVASVRKEDHATTDLSSLIAGVRRGQARFCLIEPHVEGCRVYLRASAQQRAELFALAREVALLPGVEHVILEVLTRQE